LPTGRPLCRALCLPLGSLLDLSEQCARFLTLVHGAHRARHHHSRIGTRDACPRLAPNLPEVGVERGAYEMFDFGARRAPRTVPTRLIFVNNQQLPTSSNFQLLPRAPTHHPSHSQHRPIRRETPNRELISHQSTTSHQKPQPPAMTTSVPDRDQVCCIPHNPIDKTGKLFVKSGEYGLHAITSQDVPAGTLIL
jgi:hypothetical protein